MRGLVVALVGPDGVGKTTIASRLPGRLPVTATYVYAGDNPEAATMALPTTRAVWRWRARQGGGHDHGPPPIDRPPRRSLARRLVGAPIAALLFTNQCAEEWYRLHRAHGVAKQGGVAVLDRSYLHDYYRHDIDAQRRSLLQRVHGYWLARVLPRPDLVIFLDAPIDVLSARKSEGGEAALARRRAEYLGLESLSARAARVDTARPLAEVEGEVEAIVLAALSGSHAT